MFTAITAAGVVAVVLLAKTANQHRRHAAATDVRLCRGCGNTNFDHARFCRRCGRAVGAQG